MGLIAEQTRNLENEENLYNSSGGAYEYTETDWTTKYTKSITLSEEKLILLSAVLEFWFSSDPNNMGGNGRILVDDVPVTSSGWFYHSKGLNGEETHEHPFETFVKLAAGSYTIKFQVSCSKSDQDNEFYNRLKMTDMNIGVFDLSDTDISDGDSGSTTVGAGSTVEIISKTFTTPSSRTLAVGPLNKCLAVALVHGVLDGDAVSLMKNTGESNESDHINWKIFKDGTQEDWSERVDDEHTTNPAYAEGAYGRACFILDLNTEYTIAVKAQNGFSSSKDVQAYLSVIYSPWILGDEYHQPVTFDFPQFSTLYALLEPFSRDESKTVGIGKTRVATFGDATDYYSYSSGTGILDFSYTLETVKVDKAVLHVKGFGGVIGAIGVDMR